MNIKKQIKYLAQIAALATCSVTAFATPLQLSDLPLFLDQSVPPALAVTFDDSGSMSWGYMPDSRSFHADRRSYASSDYNLIYYNPNIVYQPPIRADGTLLPDSVFSNASRDGYAPAGMITNINLNNAYQPFATYYPDYEDEEFAITYAAANRPNALNRAFYYRWTGAADATLWERREQNANYDLIEITAPDDRQNFANWYTYYNTRSKLSRAAVSHAFVNFGPNFKIDWQQLHGNRFDGEDSNMQVFADEHREDFYDWLFRIPGDGFTPLKRATMDAGRLFSDELNGDSDSVYFDSEYDAELSCQQNFHIAISDGSWNVFTNEAGVVFGEGVLGNFDGGVNTVPDQGTAYNPADYFYADGQAGTLADTAFYYWLNDLKPDLDNNVPTFIDDYTNSDGNIINVPPTTNWVDIPELKWNPKNNPANWQNMVNFNVGLGIEGGLDQENDLQALRSGMLNWPNVASDTCFELDPTNGAEVIADNCATHFCFDGPTIAANVIPCGGALFPAGDIQFCVNGDTNTTIDCDDRIVRVVSWSEGRVDDVWHASLNSRGEYFSAEDPRELSEALYKVVANIIKRKGRASAASISSSIISADFLTFKTGYDTADWSGFVIAAPLNIDGSIGAIEWDASCKLTGGYCPSIDEDVVQSVEPDARNIITYDFENGTQALFHPDDLTSDMVDKILSSPFAATISGFSDNESMAKAVMNYIRGDRDLEEQDGGEFRNRRSLLGDIMHSPAKVIRGPSANYFDNKWNPDSVEYIAANSNNGYNKFRQDNKNRNSTVLVGANDGMLHAFDAGLGGSSNGGDELWAYMPSTSLNGIADLANPDYQHKSYVDAVPHVRDAFIDGSWRTIAIGGLRKGGKLFYALDLGSDPDDVPTVLWEFSDDTVSNPNRADADMGYTYAGGVITRIVDVNDTTKSKWIALLPNGYDSSSNKSFLYALDLETGELLHKWGYDIGSEAFPNGLSTPVAADFVNHDDGTPVFAADQATDFAYAGDLAGNVYRFDMQDIFTGAGIGPTKPELFYSGSYDQPITTAPRVINPVDGSESVIVIFGTGKYIELPDRSIVSGQRQYLFGLKDKRAIASTYDISDSRIVDQLITNTTSDVRELTNFPVNAEQSWKVELYDETEGERMVNKIGVSNDRKIITLATIIPNGGDPCLPGGESWIMALNSKTGGKPSVGSLLDNSTVDGVRIADLVLGFNYLTSPGGTQTLINVDTSGNAGGSGSTIIEIGRTSEWSRRSWHRIIFD